MIMTSASVLSEQGCHQEILSLDSPLDPWSRTVTIKLHAMGIRNPRYRAWRRIIPWLRYGYTPHLVPWLKENAKRYDAIVVHGLWNYVALGSWRALANGRTPILSMPMACSTPTSIRFIPSPASPLPPEAPRGLPAGATVALARNGRRRVRRLLLFRHLARRVDFLADGIDDAENVFLGVVAILDQMLDKFSRRVKKPAGVGELARCVVIAVGCGFGCHVQFLLRCIKSAGQSAADSPTLRLFTLNVIKRLWQQLRQAGARDLNNPGLAESLGLDGVMIALGSLVIFLDDRQIIVPDLLIGDGEPLPSQAADFPFKNVFGVGLDMVAREVFSHNPHIFPLNKMAMLTVLRRMGHTETVHGFRSAFRDWGGDMTTVQREVIEAALAHATGDATELAYRRSDALEKRRKLMDAWGSFCSDRAANVLSFPIGA